MTATAVPLTEGEIARRMAAFAQNGYRFDVKGILTLWVDRGRKFDPTRHYGESWTIWRGEPDTDGLHGNEAQDERSLALDTIDFQDVSFEHFMNGQATPLDGEDRLARIAASGAIALDAQVGEQLVDERGQPTLTKLHELYGIKAFELAGTVMRRKDGYRFHAALERHDNGLWRMTAAFVRGGRHLHNLVPVIA